MSTIPKPTRRVKRGWMNLKVSRIVDETHDTKTFFLVDADEGGRPWDYVAGQYLTFRFDTIAEKPLVRSYTMSSSPCLADESAFTVKRVENGIISNWLCEQVQVGDILRARGPIGRFVYDSEIDKPELYMVAAGSGVTPFVSILREYKASLGTPGSPQKMGLLVAYRSRKDLILWEDLVDANRHEGIKIVTTLTRDDEADETFWSGRPSREMLEKFLEGTYANATYMTCGPQGMMDLTKQVLLEHGVESQHIKMESFFS